MHILMLSAECAPVAKVGGLGDFVQGLSQELGRRGHRVEVLLPKYDCLRGDHLWDLRKVADLWVPHADDWVHCDLEEGDAEGVRCLFIDPHAPQAWYQRGRIHGEPDDAERFAFYCRAALEVLVKTGRRPDILHCHDWHSGLAPVLLRESYQGQGLEGVRVCYSLHNLGHQGRAGVEILRQAGLDPARLLTPDRLQDPAAPGALNLMRGGIRYADFITTVSPRYAWEVQHTDQGMGLQGTLRAQAHKFGGVLNGIDYQVWNPATDPVIAQTYSPETLHRKAPNKTALRRRLGLAEVRRPIVAVVSRLEYQKGPELMQHGARFSLAQEAQFVLLGTTQDPEIAAAFQRLRQDLDRHPHAHIALGFDEDLAHQIFAGADIVLVPSRYEPCGLTQMTAMRYGAVPVVRRVGGLADTVVDANYDEADFHQRTGYLFEDYDPASLESALGRALGLWAEHPEYFRELRLNGMRLDHSWQRPGGQYEDIYRTLQSR